MSLEPDPDAAGGVAAGGAGAADFAAALVDALAVSEGSDGSAAGIAPYGGEPAVAYGAYGPLGAVASDGPTRMAEPGSTPSL